jgi:hypothetical protein
MSIDFNTLDPETRLICEAACARIIEARTQAAQAGKHTPPSWRKETVMRNLLLSIRHLNVESQAQLLIHTNNQAVRYYANEQLEIARFAIQRVLIQLGMLPLDRRGDPDIKPPDPAPNAGRNGVARAAQAMALIDLRFEDVEPIIGGGVAQDITPQLQATEQQKQS